MKLIVSFRRFEVKKGKPICISNGKSEIFTSKFSFKNVSGDVTFQPDKRGKHGSLAPLIIPVIDENIFDVNAIEDPMVKKRMKERLRYRREHPIQKAIRKEMIV